MLEEVPNDPMLDRIDIWAIIGGYGASALNVFRGFYLALPTTISLN